MIVVLGAPWCGWCVKVKSLLAMHDVPFLDVEPDLAALQSLLAGYDVATIPQVFIGDPRGTDPVTRIGGYQETLDWINAGKPI